MHTNETVSVESDYFDVYTCAARVANGFGTVLRMTARQQRLKEAEIRVLWLIYKNREDGTTQKRIGEEVGRSRTRVAILLDGLRRRGFITSQRHEDDRRQQRWNITTNGVQAILPIVRKLDESLLKSAEAQMAAKLFCTIVAQLQTGIVISLGQPEKLEEAKEAAHALAYYLRSKLANGVDSDLRDELTAVLDSYETEVDTREDVRSEVSEEAQEAASPERATI